jgi:glucokinase
MTTYIGIDIGGSHITAAVVNRTTGNIDPTSLRRTHVTSHSSADTILACWAETIRSTMGAALQSSCQIGIAMPGPFDYENGICWMKNVNKYDHLYGLDIRQELAKRLDIPPSQISFRNDAEAFLAGEMVFGAGRGFSKGLGITLGTGLGTSLFERGNAYDLALGINHPLHKGVAEDYISTRWFIKRYTQLTQDTIAGVKELAGAYKTNPAARQTFDEFAQNLSVVMEQFVALYQPDVIVFGGNIAQSSELFFPVVDARLMGQVTLRQSVLNEYAALMGSVSHGVLQTTHFQNF